MFETLLESRTEGQQSRGQALVSVVVHGGLILAAVEATHAAKTVYARSADAKMVYLQPPRPSSQTAPATRAHASVSANPLPKSFRKMIPPIDIPNDIPPIDIDDRPFNLESSAGDRHGGGLGTETSGDGRGDGYRNGFGAGDGGDAYTRNDLDDQVQVIYIPLPRYPSTLKSLGVEATVRLRYIVDTAGHAERNSFQALDQVRPEFIRAAEEAILKGTFKPAKLRGRPVRQWVEQPVTFLVR